MENETTGQQYADDHYAEVIRIANGRGNAHPAGDAPPRGPRSSAEPIRGPKQDGDQAKHRAVPSARETEEQVGGMDGGDQHGEPAGHFVAPFSRGETNENQAG